MLRLIAISVLVCAAGYASDVSPCMIAPLSNYIANDCSIGIFTFKQFTFNSAVVQGSPTVLNPAQIEVTPSETGAIFDLNFSSLVPNGFSVAAGQNVRYQINFLIDPLPPVIQEAGVTLNGSDPVTVMTALCEGAPFTVNQPAVSCQAPSTTLTVNTANPSASVTFPEALSALGVRDTIFLDGTNGPARFDSLDNSINAPAAATPEPGAFFLAGSGLLGVFCFRRRSKLRQVALQFIP